MRALIAFLAVFLPMKSNAEIVDELGTNNTCSYYGEKVPEKVTTFSSDQEAEDVIKRIVRASGLAQNFQVRAAGVPNAAAVIRGDVRYILYDQYFMQSTRRNTGSAWAPISIMAHEVGHHLNGHTLDNKGSRPSIELQADYYSGFVLQKMGATLEEARVAMTKLGSPEGSSTHPARHDRLAAIGNGWTEACGTDPKCNGGSSDPTPPPPKKPTPKPKPGKNSCEYANDGTCDEPDLCDAGTDTNDCRASTPSPQRGPGPIPMPSGFPSGFGMLVCGCHGFNPPMIAQEPRCQSGAVRLNQCPGFCPGGGSPYAYVCQ